MKPCNIAYVIVTSYELLAGVRIPVPYGQDVLYSPKPSRPALGPTQPSVPGFCPGVKHSEHEVDHAFPSITEVKNERSYVSTSPTCLHGT